MLHKHLVNVLGISPVVARARVWVCVCGIEAILVVTWCDKMTTYSPARLENNVLAATQLDGYGFR